MASSVAAQQPEPRNSDLDEQVEVHLVQIDMSLSGDPDASFVLTHSDRISIDELSRLIRARRYGEEPVELLLLSACQTAAGDDRAALGLAAAPHLNQYWFSD